MADNTGNSFFNGQLDPSWLGQGLAPKVLPNQSSPWDASKAAAPYGMTIQMLAVLGRVGNPAQRQWAQRELFKRAGDPTGGQQAPGQPPTAQQEQARQQFDQWDQQYADDPNVGSSMRLLMQGYTPEQVFKTMTGPGGNGLQGMDPNAWMGQINTMQNALTGIGIGSDPTHGYSADSPFNPLNTNSPFYGSSAAGFGNPTSTSFGNPTSTSSGNNAANPINASGSGNALDIAYQNQLRQTAMDSSISNPNGANTWGIQNGTAANLQGAFGGGVITPASAGQPIPAPAQPQIPGGPTTTTSAPPIGTQVAGQTLPGQNTTTTPEAIAAPSGNPTMSAAANQFQSMIGSSAPAPRTPSYFGGALGGTSTPPAPTPAAPSPVTTQPAPQATPTASASPFVSNLRTQSFFGQ